MGFDVVLRCVVLNPRGEVLLINRGKQTCYGFPEVKLNPFDDLGSALSREMTERVGLSNVDIICPIRIHQKMVDDKKVLFVSFLGIGSGKLDEERSCATRWVPIKQINDLLSDELHQDIEIALKTLRPKVGTAILVLRDGRILLGLRKGAHGGGKWAPPGGHVEFKENLVETVTRELMEETGVKVKNVRICAMTEDFFENNKHYITLFFIGEWSEGDPETKEKEKNVMWEWFEPARLPSPLFLPFENLISGRYTFATNEIRDLFQDLARF